MAKFSLCFKVEGNYYTLRGPLYQGTWYLCRVPLLLTSMKFRKIVNTQLEFYRQSKYRTSTLRSLYNNMIQSHLSYGCNTVSFNWNFWNRTRKFQVMFSVLPLRCNVVCTSRLLMIVRAKNLILKIVHTELRKTSISK